MLTFKLNTNRQTFNNNIATAEKSPIFTSHKLYTNTLATIKNILTKKLKNGKYLDHCNTTIFNNHISLLENF